MFTYIRRMAIVLAAAALSAAPVAGWSAVSFSGSFALSGSAFTDPGLVIETDRMSGPIALDLEYGETQVTPLFDIWTDETAVNADDTVPQSLRVRFSFTEQGADGEIGGETVGVRAFRGLIQYGRIVWENPLVLTFGASQLSIELSDAVFNAGLFGLGGGERNGASIGASFTLVGAPTPVPVPASIAFLAMALAGFGALSLRRRAQAA
jgi:hypothetical protein